MSKTAKEYILGLPNKLDPDKVGDAETVFHFKISGDNGGDYTVSIKDGKCDVQEGINGEAKCVVSSKASTFEDIVSGKSNPQMAFMMGKIKISNIGEMLKFASVLGLM